jgi:hypothetical protein
VTGTQIPNPGGSCAPATTSSTSVTESGLHVVFGAGQVGRSLAAQIAGPVLPVREVSLYRPSALTTTTNAGARFAAKINLAGRPPRPPSQARPENQTYRSTASAATPAASQDEPLSMPSPLNCTE